MKTTIDYISDLEQNLSKLYQHSIGLELENYELRRVVKIFGTSMCLNEQGETTISMSRAEADLVKKVVSKYIFKEVSEQ